MFYKTLLCEYTMRALTYLAQHPNRFYTAREIAENERIVEYSREIPHQVLGKGLHKLVVIGFLESRRGRTGSGYRLAKLPENITLYEIKEAIEGVTDLDKCIVGWANCSETKPCSLHDTFRQIRKQYKEFLQKTTLADMTQAAGQKAVNVAKVV